MVLLSLAGPALGGRQVFLATPLSLQPYYIPRTDQGLIYETIKMAFAASGYQVSPVYVSQREVTHILARRPDIDCAGYQMARDGDNLFTADEPYAFNSDAVTNAGNHVRLNGLSDLKGKSIIAYRGAQKFLGDKYRHAVAGNPHYREIFNHRAQVKLLLKNRVQVIIADHLLVEWYVRYLAQESSEEYKLTYHELFPPLQTRFACRDSELLGAYKAGLEEIRGNGELEKIRSRYVP